MRVKLPSFHNPACACCCLRCYRCLAAWQGRVLRRQQLEDLLQQGLVMSERMAAKAAFRVWHEVRGQAGLQATTEQPSPMMGSETKGGNPEHRLADKSAITFGPRLLPAWCLLR